MNAIEIKRFVSEEMPGSLTNLFHFEPDVLRGETERKKEKERV